jgi:hypothetical protein
MRQFLLTITLFTGLILRGYAQITVTITPQQINAAVHPDSFEIKAKANFKNTSNQTKRFVWQRTIQNMTNGWMCLVCDINQCWGSGVGFSPDTIILAANASSNLDVYIRPNRLIGAATVEMKVWEANNTTNTVTARYLFATSTAARDLPKSANNAIRIYPNPVIDYFMLTDDTDQIDRVVVYNIIGRQVKSYKVVDNFKYTVNDLPEGIYIVRLLNKTGGTIRTIRLNKSKIKA